MKCVAYLRVSSESQVKEGDSLDSQKYQIESWCRDNGYDVIHYYVDAGISAYSGRFRPQLKAMVDFVKHENRYERQVHAVVVYDLSRLTRSVEEQSRLMRQFRNSNTELISIRENITSNDPSTEFLGNILAAMNQLQSAVNGRTVTDRLYDTARKGYFTGGVIPFGYESVRTRESGSNHRRVLNIKEREAIWVRRIFKWARGNASTKPLGVKSIAAELNRRGITKRGTRWTKNAVSRILNNTVYVGELVFGKQSKQMNRVPIIIPVPAIIDDDTFNAVKTGLLKRQLKNRTPSDCNNKYLLSGILKCPKCQSNLVMMSGKSGRYKYYDCGAKIRNGRGSCDFRPIPKDDIEEEVIELIVNRVFTTENILKISKEVKERFSKCFPVIVEERQRLLCLLEKEEKKLFTFIEKHYDSESDSESETLSRFIDEKEKSLKKLRYDVDQLPECSKGLPLLKFGEPQAKLFCSKLSETLSNCDDGNANWLLKSLVSEVTVEWEEKKKMRIRGKKIALLNCVSKTKTGTDFSVPVSVSIWRRDRDLNPRTAINGCRFSRPVLSTTQPSLRCWRS